MALPSARAKALEAEITALVDVSCAKTGLPDAEAIAVLERVLATRRREELSAERRQARMEINADFGRFVCVDTTTMEWVPSRMAGVDRKMLDRLFAETGRATSVVRYEPDSYFAAHTHKGGEEYFVLDGTFSDASGDHHAGSYARNPVGSTHKPFSNAGCVIFVKLFQFEDDDQECFAKSMRPAATAAAAVAVVTELHRFGEERVYAVSLPAGCSHDIALKGGAELFVLEGGVCVNAVDPDALPGFTSCGAGGGQRHARGTWMRFPPSPQVTELVAFAESLVYVKEGQLAIDGRIPRK